MASSILALDWSIKRLLSDWSYISLVFPDSGRFAASLLEVVVKDAHVDSQADDQEHADAEQDDHGEGCAFSGICFIIGDSRGSNSLGCKQLDVVGWSCRCGVPIVAFCVDKILPAACVTFELD